MQDLKSTIKENSFAGKSVDILIPFYENYDKIAKLIESIYATVKNNPYQICLIDDYSPNSTFITSLKNLPRIKLIRNEKRLGFGGALEAGFKETSNPWVIFLNSDCLVEDPHWLNELGKSLLSMKESGVKLVSSRMNNPGNHVDERLKSKKGMYIEDCISTTAVPLTSTICHRMLFSKIGGFVKNYFPGMYEDEELFHRMKFYGFSQGISGKSWIYHEGAATFKKLNKQELEQQIENNRSQCIKDINSLNNI